MSKSMKLDDAVYVRLDAFQMKHETKSQAVDRLLTLMEKMGELRNVIEGGINYQRERTKKEGE